jgi:hypothetical protein
VKKRPTKSRLTVLLFSVLGHAEDFNIRNFFSKALKTSQDENTLSQLEQRLPKFLDLDGKSSREGKSPDCDR